MNLQVLWWAAGETGDARYRDVALAHAERTSAWHVRPDGSCDQSVHFDPGTGEPYKKHTHQGYAPEGCWARGLGWCAYGFLEAHRATGHSDFLAIARRALDYHGRKTPTDPVTFNDYDDPRIPTAPRDTSAAAILASAAIGISQVTGEERFRREGGRLLDGLVRGYLTPLGPDDRRTPGHAPPRLLQPPHRRGARPRADLGRLLPSGGLAPLAGESARMTAARDPHHARLADGAA